MSNADTAASPDTSLVVRRTYKAPRERVFDAWTNPDTLQRIMAPESGSIESVSLDPRVGGEYAISINTAEGLWTVRGRYLEIRRPERLAFTWKWDEDDGTPEHESQVTIELFERGEQTELVLMHDRLRNVESRDGHRDGWTRIADRLETYL